MEIRRFWGSKKLKRIAPWLMSREHPQPKFVVTDHMNLRGHTIVPENSSPTGTMFLWPDSSLQVVRTGYNGTIRAVYER